MVKIRLMSLLIGVLCMCGTHVTRKVIPTDQEVTDYGYTIELPDSYSLRDTRRIEPKYVGEKKGVLVLSNSPECVESEGLLYKERVMGEGRLVVHHINNTDIHEPIRMVIRLENPKAQWVKCTFLKNIVKGPCEDILYTGQRLLYDYLGEGEEEEVIFAPYETKIIYESSIEEWKKGCAISGMIDFVTDGKLEWNIIALKDYTSNYIEDKYIPVLEKDQHPRGTYKTLEKKYKIKVSGKEIEHFIVGEKDSEWEQGVDALTCQLISNKGEFGLVQRIKITAKQDVMIMMNPRGDMFKGAISLGENPVVLAPYKGELNGRNKVIVIGKVKEGTTEELVYMLPNGSAAPVLFAAVPHNGKNVEKLNKL